MTETKVEIKIDYHEKMAYITGAIHADGIEYNMKGLKARLQKQAKSDGYYGLEFWHFAEYKNNRKPGEFTFEILDIFNNLQGE